MNTIERNYEQAKEKYATIGVDTDAVLEKDTGHQNFYALLARR